FLRSAALRVSHSFPTRRSSDLQAKLQLNASVRMIVGDSAQATVLKEIEPAVTNVPDGEFVVAKDADEQRGGHSATGLVPHRVVRSEEHTSELQSLAYLVCRLLL